MISIVLAFKSSTVSNLVPFSPASNKGNERSLTTRDQEAKCPSFSVVGKLGDVVPAHMSFSSFDRGSKKPGRSQNSPLILGSLERGMRVQVSSSSSDRGSKLQGPSQNNLRVASKRDVNITKLNYMTLGVPDKCDNPSNFEHDQTGSRWSLMSTRLTLNHLKHSKTCVEDKNSSKHTFCTNELVFFEFPSLKRNFTLTCPSSYSFSNVAYLNESILTNLAVERIDVVDCNIKKC
ncbi:hypothetical protein AVEN_85038-1 [Araneus ventricosus]|uniref:Uncharacterized protein n=1 Tax=Araneus ventricosus TaxID=182803 RepID=A0A4Y2PNJ8_ARAVE|nr:hypothetical protein AVEN_85038-1 [Araneus ventricosus]